MLESAVEAKLHRGVLKLGGLSYKWVPVTTGLPDRIAILPGNDIWFIELKQSGLRPEPIQLSIHRKLRARGAKVVTLAGPDEVQAWLEERNRE